MRIELADSPSLQSLFGGPVEIVDSGARPPKENMWIDESRTQALADGHARPMLRLYAWDPWSVSLGKHQPESDIDKDRCTRFGYGLVRRPTGGRAVFHADELTYSIVLRLNDNQTVTDVYRAVNRHLLVGLQQLAPSGLEFEKSQPDFRQQYSVPVKSLPCFASSARYELVYSGRKLVGSAQRRYGRVLLQHGSILLGPGHEKLADIARLDSDEAREDLRDALTRQTATLSEIAGRPISYQEAVALVVRGFVAELPDG